MAKPGSQATAITPATPVPHAPDYTYGQLCSTRRLPGGTIRTGTLLARNGAWQNKSVVAYVVYAGSVQGAHGIRHEYVVGLQPLGRFYADGRFVPGKGTQVREVALSVDSLHTGVHDLGGWCPVEPFNPNVQAQLVHNSKDGSYVSNQSGMLPLVGDNGAGPSAEILAEQAKLKLEQQAKWASNHAKPAPPKAPEAVLADFLIK